MEPTGPKQKLESKPELKPEPEAKPEHKPESKPESKPEAKSKPGRTPTFVEEVARLRVDLHAAVESDSPIDPERLRACWDRLDALASGAKTESARLELASLSRTFHQLSTRPEA